MPLRLGASGSVRASSRHQSACRAPLAHSFWPLTTNRSPSRRAVVRRLARSDPASGSEKPWHQISPSRIAGRWRRRCSSVPASEQRRRRVVDRHEGEHEAGRIVGRQLLVEHDLLGGRHAAAPLGRPVRHGVPGGPQLLEPVLLEGDELVLGHAGLRVPPPVGHVRATPVRAPRPGSRRGSVTADLVSREQPGQAPAAEVVGESGAGAPTARTAAAAGAGWPATATTAPSRRRTRWRRGAGG